MGDEDAAVRKVVDILGGQRFGFLTTTAPDGTLISRPMAMQDVEFDGDLWFFAERDSRKTIHIAANPRVNLACGSAAEWVSVSGIASVVDDVALKRELWNGAVEAWFPGGPDDPGVILLRVEADGAEYWDTPGGRAATLVNLVRSRLTGRRSAGGENATVTM